MTVRIRVETSGQHQKFNSLHGTSICARLRQFSIRGFREIHELAVWQNCTSPTRPIGFSCTAMVLGSGLGIPIDGENTGGAGVAYKYAESRFSNPPISRNPRNRPLCQSRPAPSPQSLVSVHNYQKSKEEIRTSSGKKTRTKNINYSWRKCDFIFRKKSSDF